MESKYLEKFARVPIGLRGNRLLVEVLPKEELKSKGGLIVGAQLGDHRTSTQQNRADMAIVLAVGPGYYNEETGADEPMDVKPGNVVLLSYHGLKLYSQFPALEEYTSETIALTRDSEVHIKWDSISAFEEYKAALNKQA